MFIRHQKKVGRHVYLQLVENRWEEGATRQRIVASLGRLDRLQESGQLEVLLRSLGRWADGVEVQGAQARGELSARAVRSVGPALVVGRLWRDLGIDRELILEALQEKLTHGAKALVGDRGFRRYLRVEKSSVQIDPRKVEEARYDGKWVLRTNTELPPREVACAYKGLWQVEEAFRVLKTPLELRPIYHWTERRIRGHVMVCFLAFVLRQLLRTRLDKLGWQGSFTELLSALGRVRATVLRGEGGQTFRLRDEIPAAAMPALHAVGMRAPRRLERLD